jgi:uncharacterized RDD family membrane protein YckC
VSVVPVADPDRRVQAFAIDRLVGWGIDAAVTIAVGRLLWPHGHHLLGVLVVLVTVLVVLLVFSVLLGITGVTPGKALRGLRLVHTGTGEPIGVGPAVLRTTVLGLATVPSGLGLAALAWTAVADPDGLRRGWHDRLVSSIVLDTRPVPASQEAEAPGPRPVVNLTAARLVPTRSPSRPEQPAPPVPGGRPDARPASSWGVALDNGERIVVDTLVLLGRRPEARPGEQGARLVELPSDDRSVSQTHAQIVVAADGALVITDRGSTSGSTLVRRGLHRPLAAGRPTTLLEGDVVALGDRSLTVHRVP